MSEKPQSSEQMQAAVQQLQQMVMQLEMRTLVAEQSLARAEEAGSGEWPEYDISPGVSEGTWMTSGKVCVAGVVHTIDLDLTMRWLVCNTRTGAVRQEWGARPNPMPPDEEWIDIFQHEVHIPRF
jgi:hypothetical protein